MPRSTDQTPDTGAGALFQRPPAPVLSTGLRGRLAAALKGRHVADIASATGFSPGDVRDYLTEPEIPPTEFVVRIAVCYGLSLDWLVLGRVAVDGAQIPPETAVTPQPTAAPTAAGGRRRRGNARPVRHPGGARH